jgi:RNA polymerase sigma-19 factor, ECF subfamily
LDSANLHNEKELLLLTASGDKQAYQQLFEHYWGQVYGVAQRLTKSPEHSKDLAQDIFLKLWEQREKLTTVKNLPSFLYTITRNLVHDHLRTKVFRESNREFLMNYFSYHDESARELLEQKEQENILNDAIQSLPPQLQQVVRLSKIEGLSHDEIASRMGITALSSKTYMVRALAMLRKNLKAPLQKSILVISAVIIHLTK